MQDLAKGVVGVDTDNIEGYRDKVYKNIEKDYLSNQTNLSLNLIDNTKCAFLLS